MNRLLLLVALMALILLGGLPESAPATADTPDPSDLCTFTLQAEDSVYVDFLASSGGGGGRDVYCPMGYAVNPDTEQGVDGPEDYSYLIYVIREEDEDAASARVPVENAQFTATNLGTVGSETVVGQGNQYEATMSYFARGRYYVHGQASTGRGASNSRLQVLLAYVDNQIQIVLGAAPEPPADAEAPPADAADDAAPPDESPDIAGVFFGTSKLNALAARAENLVYCPESEGREAFIRDPLEECSGGSDAMNGGLVFERKFYEGLPNASGIEVQFGTQLYDAIILAELMGKDLTPLFPSVTAALPLIKKLVDQRALTPDGVGRFVELLAARDAIGWEKRFP